MNAVEVVAEIMIEDAVALISSAAMDHAFGVIAAAVTMMVGLYKLKKPFIYYCYSLPRQSICKRIAKRERERTLRMFKEMEPMLEQAIASTLRGHEKVLKQQQVTIASSVAESVEFKNFITGSITSMQDTIVKIANVVEKNAKDATIIKNRLQISSCGLAQGCDQRTTTIDEVPHD